jgi:uncharacterized protein
MVCGRDLMRYLALLLLPAWVYAVDCKNPENSVEGAICTRQDLRALDQRIEQESVSLKAKLTGENAAILSDSEMPFLRQRNDCSNETEVVACVQKVLAQREDLLTRALAGPDAIRQAIGQAYYIDIGFLRKYWPHLVDRKVSVFGCLMPDDTEKTHAMLETENQAAVPVVFKSMPDEIAEFLDDQKPCSHWLVTVRKQGDKFFLYADDVLGRTLP